MALQPRVMPTKEWIERAKATEDKSTVKAPTDLENDLVVFLRASYVIPSELVPQEHWPVVGTDLFEIGRFNMFDLKSRVKEALEKDGNTLASRIDVGGPKLVT